MIRLIFVFLIFENYILRKLEAGNVNISPYLNAFRIYDQFQNLDRETFSYSNPINYDFNITINFDHNLKGKSYSKSNLKVTIHSEKYDYYDIENVDNYVLNTICKFDYGTVPIFLYKTVCCRATIQEYNFTTNDFYTQNFCKYAHSRYSSACFIQLIFSKSFISRNHSGNHFYYGLKAFIFATNSENCNQVAKVTEVLAVSRLYPVSFSIGLGVVWNTVYSSINNVSLDIGRPLHSLEPDTIVSLPLRINTIMPFEYLKIECQLGGNMDIKSIVFDNSLFDADYDNLMRTNTVASIDLTFRGSNVERTQQWWIDKGLLLFIIRAQVGDGSGYSDGNINKDSWIKCAIKQMKKNNRITGNYHQTSNTKSLPLFINSGKFIIIPIFEVNPYFSILSDFQLPIQVPGDFMKVFSIHNVRDGSFIDVTSKVSCYSVDPNNVQCPNSMIKSSTNYFTFDKSTMNLPDGKAIISKWDIGLQMETWSSIIYAPLDLWIAESWRLELSDVKLSTIDGWRFPIRSSSNQRIICPSLFQTAQMKVIARLAKRNEIGEKEYYGTSDNNNAPLLDLTSHLEVNSIKVSSDPNVDIKFDLKSSQLRVSAQSGTGSANVHLYSSNTKMLLAINRVTVNQDSVFIHQLKVSCIESVDLYESSLDILSNYRQLHVENSYDNHTTSSRCYLRIIIVYSDQSQISLNDIPSEHYVLVRSYMDSTVNRVVVRPLDLSEPIKLSSIMNISLYEASTCQGSRLIFTAPIRINDVNDVIGVSRFATKLSSTTSPTTENVISTITRISVDSTLIKDLSNLYYGLYALIVLVTLVAIIVIVNCLVKLNYRKSPPPPPQPMVSSNNSQVPSDKLFNATQVDTTSAHFSSKHPPLLPPPGPLRDSSESPTTKELSSSAFWSLSSDESKRNRSYHQVADCAIPLSSLSSPRIQSNPMVGSVYSNHRYLHNPSPSSDVTDGGYLSSEQNSRCFDTIFKQTLQEIRPLSTEDQEVNESISELTTVPPPCAPLKWSIQWATNSGSVVPVFSQSCLSNMALPIGITTARTVSSSGSNSSMNQWLTKRSLPLLQTVPYTKSIDTLCEKSSGLGSLTSTQQEDSSLMSDEETYHVSINSDKETYRKYVKKC